MSAEPSGGGLALSPRDESRLGGGEGAGMAMAMAMIVALARVQGAERLIDIASAHIDGCLYHGQAGLDFAERLLELGAHVSVPTTLNVSSLDLLHPGLVRLEQTDAEHARRLMDVYVELGARSTWTCAPYQLADRPSAGMDIAWAESNAIVFANSVLGARTERYGDFVDICAAITGRAPLAGLHLDANRLPTLEIDCSGIPDRVLQQDAAWSALGCAVGGIVGAGIPLLTGIAPDTANEDRLKAFGAAAASAGGLALFHVAGVTPEAIARDAENGWTRDLPRTCLASADLRAARDALTSAALADRDGGAAPPLDAVSLGTPHFSVAEFAACAEALGATSQTFHPGCTVWICTSRAILAEATARGYVEVCEQAGARIVVDTCTYITPILGAGARTTMTTSGKWAWYAPTNLGVDVVLGTLGECIASARAGRVTRNDADWN